MIVMGGGVTQNQAQGSHKRFADVCLVPVLWCRDLMVRVASMYSPVKVLPYIQEGLNSKNNRWAVPG